MNQYKAREIVKAIQFDKDNLDATSMWVEWVPEFVDQGGSNMGGFYRLKWSQHIIRHGGWIVRKPGRVDEISMSDKEFQEKYELLTRDIEVKNAQNG